jgi:hypothetical protein
MTLRALIEKSPDADLLREMIFGLCRAMLAPRHRDRRFEARLVPQVFARFSLSTRRDHGAAHRFKAS